MKRLLFAVLFLLLAAKTFSQNGSGQWIWMKGDSTYNGEGSYDLQHLGVFDSTNEPLATYLSCGWTDKKHHFWLFGGMYNDSFFGIENLNTLWQFDPSINQWALMRTSPTADDGGEYGTQGVPDSANIPASRSGSATWVDSAGNLWLFGGGFYYGTEGIVTNYSDLWKYDITTNEWTWMKGSNLQGQFGVYGTKGVPDPANMPGARSECATWVDDQNNLWLFGGKFYFPGENYYSDIWKYNIASNEWTWEGGPNTDINYSNYLGSWHYGQKNVADPTNVPPARYGMSYWNDDHHNLYIFGGFAYFSLDLPDCFFNDTWKFNTDNNEWTWISGDSLPYKPSLTGPFCQFYNQYHSCSRYAASCWKDLQGKFWMMGGSAKWMNSAYFFDVSRDVWCFDPNGNEWMKAYKDSFPSNGFYGHQEVASPYNDPYPRKGAVSWVDSADNFWVFGGYWQPDFFMNNLWKYIPDTTCYDYIPTALTEIHSTAFSLSPNPTHSQFNLTYNLTQTATLTITNTYGSVVKTLTLYPYFKNRIVEVGDLTPGVYLVTLRDQNRVVSEKLVVE